LSVTFLDNIVKDKIKAIKHYITVTWHFICHFSCPKWKYSKIWYLKLEKIEIL